MDLCTVINDQDFFPVPPKRKAADEAGAVEESQPADDKSDNEDADSASEAQETWTPDAGTLLFPWEASEAFWGSVLQGFHSKSLSTTCLIDFTPGSGVAALAAVRGRYRYTGYASTATHEKFLRQYVMYKIVTEMILNIDAASWNTKKRDNSEAICASHACTSPLQALLFQVEVQGVVCLRWEGGTGVHAGFNPLLDQAAAYSENYAELTFFGLFNLGVCEGLEAGIGTPATYAGCYLELAFGPWRVGLEGGVSTDGPYAGGFGAAAHSRGAEWPR
ncbi:hypothetical protein AK812_SmicGene301 [Symbiodinium microadriaticum]|uniref:Uncharacterized protein n=1 Tax=Symbiodinium microadriaticum TaxID=2951 RepID=A0A1Q9F6W1_SYMMI|nr:hypothetical protein AK812_SmicGene301 [Symbiodinium microadriaticum]